MDTKNTKSVDRTWLGPYGVELWNASEANRRKAISDAKRWARRHGMTRIEIYDDKRKLLFADDVEASAPPEGVKVLPFVENDGGRAAAGFKGHTGDCVARAIAIAGNLPYLKVYDDLNDIAKGIERPRKGKKRSHARTGVHRPVYEAYLKSLGFKWVPTMKIGQGCKVHLRAGEVPSGRLVVSLSGHLCAVIDGVIHDTHDPSRFGTRCVYGYYIAPEGIEKLFSRE